jgi:hypothetical protein
LRFTGNKSNKKTNSMTESLLLEQTLAENLSWNRARIKFLSKFLLALFAARTVNLAQIAVFFGGRATVESNYKRIKRFLRFFEIREAELAHLIVRWMRPRAALYHYD